MFSKKNIIVTLLIFIIPVTTIILYFDSYSITTLEQLGISINNALNRKLSGIESELEIYKIFRWFIFLFIVWNIVRIKMNSRRLNLAIKQLDELDPILFIWSMSNIIAIYGALWGFAGWSQINTVAKFESTNFILAIVIVGLILKLGFYLENVLNHIK